MRAQISLQFADADLFENFVTPYKKNRLLNSLIIKCLSAYYYNEDVRNLIEGTSMSDATNGEEVQSTQSIVDNIRASLVMQDYLATELQSTIDNGTEDIDNILNKTNEVARQTGVAKPSQTESGSNVLQIETKNLSGEGSGESSAPDLKGFDNNAAVNLLLNCVLSLAKSSGNTEVQNLINHSGLGVADAKESVSSETVSKSVQTEVPMEQEKVTPISTKIEVEDDYAVEEVVETSGNDFEDSTSVVTENQVDVVTTPADSNSSESASEAMQELLGSLF
jgi:hypothetical protein